MCGACIVFCLLLHAFQLSHDVLLPAPAPEAADDSGQFRRSWSLGRDKTKQKGKVMLTHAHTMSVFLPHLRPGWEFT